MSDELAPDDVADVVPVPEDPHRPPACPQCGGTDLTRGLMVYLSGEVGSVGFKYESTGRFLGMALTDLESLRADLCNACGTVTRFYVRGMDRKWV